MYTVVINMASRNDLNFESQVYQFLADDLGQVTQFSQVSLYLSLIWESQRYVLHINAK